MQSQSLGVRVVRCGCRVRDYQSQSQMWNQNQRPDAEQGCRVRVRVGWMQSQRLAEPESDVDAETSRARVRVGWM